MSALHTTRLLSLVLSFAFGIVALSTSIDALAKSNRQKATLRREAAKLSSSITVDIDTHDVFASGVVVTVVSGLIALVSFLALAHAALARARPSKAAAAARTVPLFSAHLLAFLALWLFATIVPFTDFVANREAKITAYLGSTPLSASTIQSEENALGLTPVYHKLGYLVTGAILPWFTFLFASTSAGLSYLAARRARYAYADGREDTAGAGVTTGGAAEPMSEKQDVKDQVVGGQGDARV
ncbi:uncharacterized protein LAESUDRAFT_729817 [Laetiporus sulphureus 93-53]|uniref:Uncharacterized protein n=1 Tax=Laetiporus sulphureus 93-53 TaxID=1314785 RepID=A0A165CHW0_9APHY|nr:uncharacterized protein LAESUDRAFT_729817 [Laetiporus sulphureus 93-53]KZT02846.1 hypothetical protein LAESUDRAFT_729817 [Laetiporus sulphureus 93-53]